MLDLSARIDLFAVPVLPDYAQIFSIGFTIPGINRRLALSLDATRYLNVQANLSVAFSSEYNLFANVGVGPLGLYLTLSKPWKPPVLTKEEEEALNQLVALNVQGEQAAPVNDAPDAPNASAPKKHNSKKTAA